MEKKCMLVSGPTIATDKELYDELQKDAIVLQNLRNNQIESIIRDEKVDLILVEISKGRFSEVEIIKKVKINYPNIEIIIINGNGDSEVIAKAFNYGAKDAFRIPYKRALIVERTKAVLGLGCDS